MRTLREAAQQALEEMSCCNFNSAAERLRAALAQPDDKAQPVASSALGEVIGCFEAALVEGLQEALASTEDERLKDLVERRLMYALYAAQNAAPQPASRAIFQEDALKNLVNQIRKTSPVDDHGHKLTMNMAYLEACKLLDASAEQQADPAASQPPVVEKAIAAAHEQHRHYRVTVKKPAEQVCRCSLRTRIVGDGCEVCNPELAKELAEQGAELSNYPPLPEPDIRRGGFPNLYREDQMRAYVDADRAARGGAA